jgi:hypothetical protein
MPVNRQNLIECFQKMKAVYIDAPIASVRSQSFINVLHDWCVSELRNVGIEEIIGDCISLHDRFPMAVLCYIYLLPQKAIKNGVSEAVNLDRAERLFKRITGRNDWREPKDKYEHFAFLKVDFETDPPAIIETSPLLCIDNFFDKIVQTYNDRKPL